MQLFVYNSDVDICNMAPNSAIEKFKIFENSYKSSWGK